MPRMVTRNMARVTLCGLLLVLLAASCSDGDVTVSSITISPGGLTLAVGQTQELTANVQAPGNIDRTVTWSSDDTTIARVDANGLVTAVGPGTTTVAAMSNYDTSLEATVTVAVTSSAREPLWTRKYNTGSYGTGMGVATDSNDSIVVTGYVDYHPDPQAGPEPFDAFVRKYSSDGTLVWHREFGALGNVISSGLAIDAADNIVISGTNYTSLNGGNTFDTDAFVRKYSPNGDVLWTRGFDHGRSESRIRVAIDDLGSVIVAGFVDGPTGSGDWSGGSGGMDGFLRKYSASGTLLWAKRFDTAEDDEVHGVAVDVDGNIVVTGVIWTGELFANPSDMFATKYSPDGNRLWTDRFGSDHHDSARSVAIDADGNVIVGGHATHTIGGATRQGDGRYFVRKYARDGSPLWTHQFGSADALASIFGVTADANSDIVVAGYGTGKFELPQTGNDDVFVGKLTRDGKIVWTDQFGTSNADDAEGVTTDSMGTIIITGRIDAVDTGNGVKSEVFVRKYGP